MLIPLTIVQIEHADLCATIVEKPRSSDEASHTSNADDVTLLHIKHTRKELFDQHEVRNNVDLEDLVKEHAGRIEHVLSRACRFGELRPQMIFVGSDSGQGLGRLDGS
jgi:hypothetical protein